METELESKLAEARKVRARKILAGAKVEDTAAISALETEIEIQHEVEAERINRERQAAQEAAEKDTAAKPAQLEAMIADDLRDVAEAEALRPTSANRPVTPD